MHNISVKNNAAKLIVFILAVALIAGGVIVAARTAGAQAPPAAAPGSTLEQRVAQRKAERNVTLTAREQQRLTSTCVLVQTKIRALQQKTTPALDNRAKIYKQIDGKLLIMIGKLKIAEKDTSQLEKRRAGFADKINAFQSSGQSYSQALDDIAAVNCKADLVGFKALLETARLYRPQIRAQSDDIRNYLNNDVKPAISAIATELQANPATTEEN